LEKNDYVVIDAEGAVLGRLGTATAKMLLGGKKVAVINAEKAVITGNWKNTLGKYKTRRGLQEKENPEHSPKWPRRPDFLVKRIVRGMLPYRKPSGKEAYKRLTVFIGVPEELNGAKPIDIKIKGTKEVYSKYSTVNEIAGMLGYKIK
jgi:large subunit ribosomal protein L13